MCYLVEAVADEGQQEQATKGSQEPDPPWNGGFTHLAWENLCGDLVCLKTQACKCQASTSGCSSVVEHTPHGCEVMGSNLARCWA